MIEISISLGSNIDPKTNLIKANELIKEKFNIKNFRNSPKWIRLSRLKQLIRNKKINKKLYWIKSR